MWGGGQTWDSDPWTLPWTQDVLLSPTKSGYALRIPSSHQEGYKDQKPFLLCLPLGLYQEGRGKKRLPVFHLPAHPDPPATQAQFQHDSVTVWVLVGVGKTLLPAASMGLAVSPH